MNVLKKLVKLRSTSRTIALVCTIAIVFFTKIKAQEKPYFQQQVEYKIAVTLDDKKHVLTGWVEMNYTNNSTDPLSIIYILLQPNAYKNKNTAFAKQELSRGKTRFYFAESSEMGSISQMEFQVDGARVELEIDKQNPDIAKLKLNTPIQPNATAKITSPFTYKIPAVFSRGGHAKQQYLMTQWYPKPAVYDRDGWHPQSYLDQGEFYAEFGNYDVSLTLPDNYIVGATGYLVTGSEMTTLSKRNIETYDGLKQLEKGKKASEIWSDTFPKSSEKNKTIRYTAQNVHDFAWFADKRFLVLKSDTLLKSGKRIDTWTFFAPKHVKNWKRSDHFVNRAVRFYSDQVGEYPHPQASAVMADEGFGGGMEYPMITVLSGMNTEIDVDGTIAHEVGHNWFQGILANNEREHAWLDEGLNSFYDNRYMKTYYPNLGIEEFGVPKILVKKTDYDIENLMLHYVVWKRQDQAPTVTSNGLTSMNYGLSAYQKPSQALQILERHVGSEKFDDIMQAYFKKWQFKHPTPADFKKMWTDDPSVGDVSWLFDGLLNSTKHVDYQIVKLENGEEGWHKLTVKNKGQVAAPFTVSAVKNDSAVWSTRLDGIEAGETSTVLVPKKHQADMLTVDFKHHLLDLDRTNDNIKTNGIFKKIEPLSIRMLPQLDHSRKTNIYAQPLIGVNAYDKFMVGAWLHNGFLPLRNWNVSLAPMYSLGSKSLVGLGNVDYSFFAGLNRITLGIGARQFGFDYNQKFEETKIYRRLTPSVSIDFQGSPTSKFSSTLTLRHLNIREEGLAFDSTGKYLGKQWATPTNITEVSYSGLLKNALGNTSFRVAAEYQAYSTYNVDYSYLKLSLSARKNFVYQRGKQFSARFFAAYFPQNKGREAGDFFGSRTRGAIGLVSNGKNDYRYDGLWLGRSHDSSVVSQQIDPYTEGGFKFVAPQGSPFEIGYSNDFALSLNLTMDLPVNLPQFLQLKPYFDIGYFSDKRPSSLRSTTSMIASGGINWQLFNGIANVYFPLYFSGKPLEEDPNSFKVLMTTRRKFYERITFSLDLKRLNPRKMLDNIF